MRNFVVVLCFTAVVVSWWLLAGRYDSRLGEIREIVLASPTQSEELLWETISPYSPADFFTVAHSEEWAHTPIEPWTRTFQAIFHNSTPDTWIPSFEETHFENEVSLVRLATQLALERELNTEEELPKYMLELVAFDSRVLEIYELQMLAAASGHEVAQQRLLSVFMDHRYSPKLRELAFTGSIQQGNLQLTFATLHSFLQLEPSLTFLEENQSCCRTVLKELLRVEPLLGIDCSTDISVLISCLSVSNEEQLAHLASEMPLLSEEWLQVIFSKNQ